MRGKRRRRGRGVVPAALALAASEVPAVVADLADVTVQGDEEYDHMENLMREAVGYPNAEIDPRHVEDMDIARNVNADVEEINADAVVRADNVDAVADAAPANPFAHPLPAAPVRGTRRIRAPAPPALIAPVVADLDVDLVMVQNDEDNQYIENLIREVRGFVNIEVET